MNDKNFIEELKQKREEYEVTQRKLALACGISREYYNRIEKGKIPLTEELKETLEKQIERFNPQEPLFLGWRCGQFLGPVILIVRTSPSLNEYLLQE